MNIIKLFQKIYAFLLIILLSVSYSGLAQVNTESQSLPESLNSETFNLNMDNSSSLFGKGFIVRPQSNRVPLSTWTGKDIETSSLFKLMSNPEDVYWDDRFDQLGMNGPVLAIAVNGTEAYIGGSFTMAGTLSVNNIAKWDGNSWSILGSIENNGVNGLINAIAVSGNNVYVGGVFTSAGAVSVNNIAKWDGNSWYALGSGIDGDVRAIAASLTDVYVGGVFTAAGGSNANNIAKWNGNNWATLDSGTNGPVYTIAVKDNDIYVGGSFTTAGGVNANNIVLWSNANNTWSPLDNGVNLDVNTIVVIGNDIYAGGLFTLAGTVSVKKIARWDGNNWSALDSGISGGDVNAMEVIGSNLYVGGSFSRTGVVSANNIAKWDGNSWSTLGSGIAGGPVFAIGISLNDVYVGGSFTTAGGKPSEKFARWNDQDGTVPVELVSFTAHPYGDVVELRWKTATETINYGFDVERMVIGPASLLTSIDNTSQTDENQWEKIAFVKGNGTTNQPQSYSYTDNVQNFTRLTEQALMYRLKQIDLDGSFKYHESIKVLVGAVPNNIVLTQNYPNPFNPETTIEFTIPRSGLTTLKVYNNLGQEIITIVNEYLEEGIAYKVKFDAHSLPSGSYYYTLRSGNMVETKKMLLLK